MSAKSFLSLRVIDALETRTVLAVRSDFFRPRIYERYERDYLACFQVSEIVSLVFIRNKRDRLACFQARQWRYPERPDYSGKCIVGVMWIVAAVKYEVSGFSIVGRSCSADHRGPERLG